VLCTESAAKTEREEGIECIQGSGKRAWPAIVGSARGGAVLSVCRRWEYRPASPSVVAVAVRPGMLFICELVLRLGRQRRDAGDPRLRRPRHQTPVVRLT
jgi:hypothetical protein